jgi:hypothetical protein
LSAAVGIAETPRRKESERLVHAGKDLVDGDRVVNRAIAGAKMAIECRVAISVDDPHIYRSGAPGRIARGAICQRVVPGGNILEGEVPRIHPHVPTERAEVYDAVLRTPSAPRKVLHTAFDVEEASGGRCNRGSWCGCRCEGCLDSAL